MLPRSKYLISCDGISALGRAVADGYQLTWRQYIIISSFYVSIIGQIPVLSPSIRCRYVPSLLPLFLLALERPRVATHTAYKRKGSAYADCWYVTCASADLVWTLHVQRACRNRAQAQSSSPSDYPFAVELGAHHLRVWLATLWPKDS